jgi:hypothetical protein
MWWWHDMPFGNKVSQIFMAIHDFLWHHKFLCVLNLHGTNIFMACYNFLCAMSFWSDEFTRMCMCTKQFIINL